MGVRWGILLLGLGILSACTVVPTGPSVLVLPAVGKSMDVFQGQYDRAYVQCMYAKGNVVPGVVVAPGASVAPPPLGTPSPGTPQR